VLASELGGLDTVDANGDSKMLEVQQKEV